MIETLGVTLGLALLAAILAILCVRRRSERWRRTRRGLAVLLIGLCLPLVGLSLYLGAYLAMGQPPAVERPLPNGAVYRRHVLTTPDRVVLHLFEIRDPASRPWVVTRPITASDGLRAVATHGPTAAAALQADLVINANFFSPFHDYHLFNSSPALGQATLPIGEVVSDGVRYGVPKPDWPSVWQRTDGSIGFGALPKDTQQAVTGRQWLLKDGEVAVRKDEPPYPRSAIAMNASGDRLWLIVVDGKQPRYSVGLTLSDFAAYLKSLGANNAIEFDGGGSSILVHRDATGVTTLSRPCHEKIPGRQRPTGVFLGIRLTPPPMSPEGADNIDAHPNPALPG